MALTNDQITAQNFKDFYDQIYPYLGQGGGGTGGGHTIQDDGTDMTARDNLNFVGMDVDDNSAEGSTDVAEHRLTSAEISEMMGGIPNPTPRYPIMFDERGTEYKVGWYILSNGTKKPVYQKTFMNVALDTDILTNVDTVVDFRPSSHGAGSDAAYHCVGNGFTADSSKLYKLTNGTLRYASWTLNESEMIKTADFITVLYTKTTDTPV